MKFWFEKGAWASSRAKRKVIQKRPEDIRSIAVIRHAALGDMVLTRCFLKEARKFFPNATITLSVVSHYNYGVPEDLVDRVHVIHWHDRGMGNHKKYSEIRELGYQDIIFDLAATNRSLWICFLTPAWLKIGFPYRHISGKFFYDVILWRSDMRFEAEVMLDMLNLLGCHSTYPPQFKLSGDALQSPKPYIVYFTGGSVESKRWPEEQFSQLIAKMAQQYQNYDHIILEGVQISESISELMDSLYHHNNIQSVKAQDLVSTISLLKGATLLISNDTGIRNLAIAAETPTLGIFFSTVPFRYWPRYGLHNVVFQSNGELPEVNVVFKKAKELLENIHC
jgi:ADP-heptose:LPS heptosyltransferase